MMAPKGTVGKRIISDSSFFV